MTTKRIFVLIFPLAALALLAPALLAPAQFRPTEVAERESWEEFLRAAEIVDAEPIREGVTHPWKLALKKDGVETKAVWKDIDSEAGGIPDHWRYEIAAYRLDKLLGLKMVPVAVEREFKRKRGYLSLWAENKYSLLRVMEEGIAFPAAALAALDDAKSLTRAWDSLIANDDRTQQNILYTEDWRTILIDHTRAFRADKEHRERLIYGANGIKTVDDGRGGRKPALFRRLPRVFVDGVRALDEARIRAAVGPYLTDAEAEALLARKSVLLAEIEAMIRTNGEARVLY